MIKQEIIEQLKSLKSHCEDFRDGEDSVWAKDVEALDAAIEALEKQATSEWIPASERLPEEHDTMFAKKSDKVNVTVEFDDGSRMTQTLYTIDGEWKRETNIKHKVIAWRPLPEPYKENE